MENQFFQWVKRIVSSGQGASDGASDSTSPDTSILLAESSLTRTQETPDKRLDDETARQNALSTIADLQLVERRRAEAGFLGLQEQLKSSSNFEENTSITFQREIASITVKKSEEPVWNPFLVNRAARDSQHKSLYALSVAEELSKVGDDIEKAVAAITAITKESERALSTATSTTSLASICSSLTVMRDRLSPPSANLDSEALPNANGRDASYHESRNLQGTVADARGLLGEISSSLSLIETRLVAQCALTPFGNNESLQCLDRVRLVQGQLCDVDKHLRDLILV